mmetsp:Transcript_9230/g.25837  ORF Transcript_9230/g.25837 Transcript_9230/m.25837 type:complete len:246 (-) Transcript_9230:25-762(-)
MGPPNRAHWPPAGWRPSVRLLSAPQPAAGVVEGDQDVHEEAEEGEHEDREPDPAGFLRHGLGDPVERDDVAYVEGQGAQPPRCLAPRTTPGRTLLQGLHPGPDQPVQHRAPVQVLLLKGADADVGRDGRVEGVPERDVLLLLGDGVVVAGHVPGLVRQEQRAPDGVGAPVGLADGVRVAVLGLSSLALCQQRLALRGLCLVLLSRFRLHLLWHLRSLACSQAAPRNTQPGPLQADGSDTRGPRGK